MGKLKINNVALEKQVIEQIIKPAAKKYNQAGIKALKEIREKSVTKWYGVNSIRGVGMSLNESTFYRSKIKSDSKGVSIIVTSSVNIKKYEALKGNGLRGINRWRKKHEVEGWTYIKKDGTMSDEMPAVRMTKYNTTAEYVIGLKWDKGIVKLPKKSSKEVGTDWVNRDYKKASQTLKNAVKESIEKSWDETVNKFLV